MRCEEVGATLSLYVAGEVGQQRVRERIAAHLLGCASCRALAGEWEASREMLRLHEPPEFDAAFFDGIRRDVLRQISEAPPSLSARLYGQIFDRRTLAYATAFSLLVCVALLSVPFLRRGPTPVVSVAKQDKGGSSGGARTDGPGKPDSATSGDKVKKDEVPASKSEPATARRHTVRPARAAATRSVREEKSARLPDAPDAEQSAGGSGVRGVGVEPANRVPMGGSSPERIETAAAADSRMLRIELQTSDPNIRIIWLSPRTTDHASSNKLNR